MELSIDQNQDNTSVLIACCGVMLLHAAVWFAFSLLKVGAPHQPAPFKTVQVSLLSLPPPMQPPAVARVVEAPKLAPPVNPPLAPARAAPAPARPAQDTAPDTPATTDAPPASAAAAAVSTPDAAPQPAPPQAPPVEPVVEPPRFQAASLVISDKDYPPAARRRGIEGRVLVRAEISATGECLRTEVKSGSHFLLNQAAVEKVMQARFTPAKRGNQAVAGWTEVLVKFELNPEES